MSYEGYEEFLCANGHYHCTGSWDEELASCPFCKAPIAYSNNVDVTNGEDESEPWTMPAPKEEIGFDDDWRQDHYGNKYAVKVIRYDPIDRWHATYRLEVALPRS